MDNKEIISIPVEKYEKLLDTATRVEVLKNIASGSKYSIDPGMLVKIFDFDLPPEGGGE